MMPCEPSDPIQRRSLYFVPPTPEPISQSLVVNVASLHHSPSHKRNLSTTIEAFRLKEKKEKEKMAGAAAWRLSVSTSNCTRLNLNLCFKTKRRRSPLCTACTVRYTVTTLLSLFPSLMETGGLRHLHIYPIFVIQVKLS